MTALTVAQVRALGGYRVVYADPPWSYDQKVRKTLDEAQYKTMGADEVAALPVGALAAEDSALFLWCTWPQVAQGTMHVVARAWGFDLKTLAFLWVKRNKAAGTHFWGAGSWTRANTEPCFLATRGHPRRAGKGVHQLVEEFVPEEVLDAERPGAVHSAKPPCVRERIVELMGEGFAVELFARDRCPGWDAWGDQVPGGNDLFLAVP